MFDCAIIGAGLAGLSAAQELVRRGISVVVVEARDRIGGRVENGFLSDGELVELGGQWIGPGHDLMYELAERYGLGLIGLPSTGEFTIRLQGKTLHVPSKEDAPMLTPFEVADLGQGVMRFRRLADRLVKDEAWAIGNAVWLQQDLRSWISTNLRTAGGAARFSEIFEAAFGPVPEDATLEMGLHQATSGVDLEGLAAANGGLHQHRIEGGIFALCEHMAAELGDRIRLAAPVVGIAHSGDSATITLDSGETIKARRVINTMPPRLSVRLAYDPPLPQWRSEVANKVPPGNVIKAFLTYDEPWWRSQGLSGQMGSDEGAVRVTLETSGQGRKRGTLLGFFEGADADSLSRRSVTLRQRAFTDSLVRAFGEIAANPAEYIERDWTAEPYTGGCHGAHFAPGVWTATGPQLAQSEGVLYWAGAEYATRFNGYMEGAVRSGRETAASVARELV